MKIRTTLKAGGFKANHNERATESSGVKLQSCVKAGGLSLNHNERATGR